LIRRSGKQEDGQRAEQGEVRDDTETPTRYEVLHGISPLDEKCFGELSEDGTWSTALRKAQIRQQVILVASIKQGQTRLYYFSRKPVDASSMDVMNEARELLPVIRWCRKGRPVTPEGEDVKCPTRLNQQQGRRAAFGILADNGWAMIDIQPDDRLVVMEARKPGLDKGDFGPQVAKALHAIGWPMALAASP
jgi:hypothetical protein